MNMLFAIMHKARVVVLSMSQVWYPQTGSYTNPETAAETYDRRTLIADTALESAMRGNTEGFDVKDDVPAISKFHPVDALALIITIEQAESGFDYFVHAGEASHLGTQDTGKARCLGQVQTWKGNTLLTDEEHKSLSGTDYQSTLNCANAIHEYLWYHAERCRVRGRGRVNAQWSNQQRMSHYEAKQILSYYAKGTCSPRFRSKAERRNLNMRAAAFRNIQAELDAEELPEMPDRPIDRQELASNP